MATNYPGSYDSFPAPGTNLSSTPNHDDMHIDVQDAVEAVQAELGLNPRGSSATVAARLTAIEGRNGASVSRVATAQSVGAGATADVIWDTEVYDAGGYYSGPPATNIFVPTTGIYVATATMSNITGITPNNSNFRPSLVFGSLVLPFLGVSWTDAVSFTAHGLISAGGALKLSFTNASVGAVTFNAFLTVNRISN